MSDCHKTQPGVCVCVFVRGRAPMVWELDELKLGEQQKYQIELCNFSVCVRDGEQMAALHGAGVWSNA